MNTFIIEWFLFILGIFFITAFFYSIYRMIRYQKDKGEIKRNLIFMFIEVILFVIVLFLYVIPQIIVG